jgi:hypothetical protein
VGGAPPVRVAEARRITVFGVLAAAAGTRGPRSNGVGGWDPEQELYVYCCSDCAAEVADLLGPDYVTIFLDGD